MDGDTSSSATPSGVQGICPQGWHLPSCDEWETLNSSLGGNVPASDFSAKAGGYYSVGHHLGQTCIYCQFGETAFFATSEAGTAYVWTKGETKLKKKRCQSRQFISVRLFQVKGAGDLRKLRREFHWPDIDSDPHDHMLDHTRFQIRYALKDKYVCSLQ